MLTSCCAHDQNSYISSSCCMANHVEEIKKRLAHIIEEEIARRTKKDAISRTKYYECHEYGHFTGICPTLDNEESSSPDGSSSSPKVHMCLMARGSKVTPTLNPIISHNDESDNDDEEEEIDEVFFMSWEWRMLLFEVIQMLVLSLNF